MGLAGMIDRVEDVFKRLKLIHEEARLRVPHEFARIPSKFMMYSEKESHDFFNATEVWWYDSVKEDWVIFKWEEEQIILLEKEAEAFMKGRLECLKKLWISFTEAKGVFVKEVEAYSIYAGQSITGSGARYDEGEYHYFFVGGKKLSEKEYLFLNDHVAEIVVPEGMFRATDDINSLHKVVMPATDDVLVAWGKTGRSRHGVSPTGEMYRGHPARCPYTLNCKWVYRWTLNGNPREACEISVGEDWNNPVHLAQRALWKEYPEIRIPDSWIEGLATFYEKEGVKV